MSCYWLTLSLRTGNVREGEECFKKCLLPAFFYTISPLQGYKYNLVDGLLASSQYPEGPATGHLGTGFSWFRCVYKRMLTWFPRLQVATACFSYSLPDLNFLDLYIHVHAL